MSYHYRRVSESIEVADAVLLLIGLLCLGAILMEAVAW